MNLAAENGGTSTSTLAVIAIVMSALSLGWQAATFFLTAGRVKVELHKGGLDRAKGRIVTAKPSEMKAGWGSYYESIGYTTPIIAVKVRNVGRLPVTVASWGLVESVKNTDANPIDATLAGPRLPHRLEAGESETWAATEDAVRKLCDEFAHTLDIPADSFTMRATVRLADGRVRKSRNKLSKP